MSRRILIAVAIASGLALAAAAIAADHTVEALSGDLFKAGDQEIRLVDILAPARLASPEDEPFADEARRALEAMMSPDMRIDDSAPPDRWSRRAAKVFATRDAAETIQESLIAAGLARVRPETDDTEFINSLLAFEAKARASRTGLWGHWKYQVFDALDAGAASGAFSLVEGEILQASAGRGRIYLNFGEDFRTDFTVTARPADARRWKKSGLDLLALQGRKVRVRGFVAFINGPSIELLHPLQIEVLDGAVPPPPTPMSGISNAN